MKHNCTRHRKRIPYGQKRGKYWCDVCDAELVDPEPNKKAERQRAKKQISKDLK